MKKRTWLVAGLSSLAAVGSMASLAWAGTTGLTGTLIGTATSLLGSATSALPSTNSVSGSSSTLTSSGTASGTTTSPLIQQNVGMPKFTGSHWTPEPAKYGIVEQQNVPIRMSDGTVLMADVYRPANLATGKAAKGAFPVILTQTPYRKTGALTTIGGDGYYPYLVQRGYINVIVDVRGTGSSEGTWQFFGPREVQDGVHLVNWCANSRNLPGSDGKVGLAGASYLGINQLLIAGAVGKHSPLKAIFPIIAGNDIYRDTAFEGGIPDTEFSIPWLALRGGLDVLPSDNTANNPTQAVQVLLQHAGRLVSFDAPFLTNIETGGSKAYDGQWWQQRNPRNVLKQVVANGIPAFMVGGWFDLFQHGELLNYTGLQNAAVGRPVSAPMTATQRVTPRYQLVMGPWYHLTATQGQEQQVLQLAWFDQWLKGINTGILNTKDPMHLYELSSNRWVNTARWPVTNTMVKTLYFNAGPTGTATSLYDGALTTTKPTAASGGSDTLPWFGVNIPFGRSIEQWEMGATTFALSQAGLPPLPYTTDDRAFEADGLTYTTAPFKKAEDIAGPIDVTLYATSTTPDTEFVATVEEVKPNGQAYPLTSGALLGSMRSMNNAQSWKLDGKLIMPWHPYTKTSQHPVPTGTVTQFNVEVFPTFDQIAAGDRLRITITSSDEPHLTPSPVQVENLAGGVYQIERTQKYSSFVNIPFAPAKSFTPSSVAWGPSGS